MVKPKTIQAPATDTEMKIDLEVNNRNRQTK